jgi:hypothetical protein
MRMTLRWILERWVEWKIGGWIWLRIVSSGSFDVGCRVLLPEGQLCSE